MADSDKIVARPRTGALLFLPPSWQRVAVLKWLKRVHAWTGLWGAALFLLMGTSGFLLNHRNLLKIDTGKPVEVSSLDIPVPALADEDALDAWARATLGLRIDGKAPPPEPAGPKAMLGRTLPEAERWTRVFTQTDAKGNRQLSARRARRHGQDRKRRRARDDQEFA